jgi:hypothetical protein
VRTIFVLVDSPSALRIPSLRRHIPAHLYRTAHQGLVANTTVKRSFSANMSGISDGYLRPGPATLGPRQRLRGINRLPDTRNVCYIPMPVYVLTSAPALPPLKALPSPRTYSHVTMRMHMRLQCRNPVSPAPPVHKHVSHSLTVTAQCMFFPRTPPYPARPTPNTHSTQHRPPGNHDKAHPTTWAAMRDTSPSLGMGTNRQLWMEMRGLYARIRGLRPGIVMASESKSSC